MSGIAQGTKFLLQLQYNINDYLCQPLHNISALQPSAVNYSPNSTGSRTLRFQTLVARSGSAGQVSQTSSATRQGSLSRCQRQLGFDWDHP